jgi:outer membrane protein insertion porin family
MRGGIRGLGGPVLVILWCLALPAAAESFVIEDIEVEGLQRISAGTLFTYLPVNIGDTFDESQGPDVVKALFRTGFFKDVELLRRDGVLVVRVEERPAVAEINLSGNKEIKEDQILDAMKRIGISKGRVFNQSLLDRVEQELQRLYFSLGKYGARIETKVTDLERNRVAIDIDISEGKVAKIRHMNIVGNERFTEKELLKEFESGVKGPFAWFSKKDRYSKPKLTGDLEALRSYYQDRGYLKFEIESTQVSISPDKKDIFITININEGDLYRISDVKLAGDLVVAEKELLALVEIKGGEIFSRRRVAETIKRITDRLSDEGYAFANVNAVPNIDEEKKEVGITFFVDPGRRVYINRISFSGNDRTREIVFRREMRQMEGTWFSGKAIDRSKVRIQRLSYIEQVNVETPPVPGSEDEVDININVKERMSGNFSIGAGFSQTQGVIFTLGLSQDNFLGTGKRISGNFSFSKAQKLFSFVYTNPYRTVDGVSRGFNFTYRYTDAAEVNITSFLANEISGGVFWGIPLSEYNTLRTGVDLEDIEITTVPSTSEEILEFIDENGDHYLDLVGNASVSFDNRDRVIFPSRGILNRVGLDLSGGDLDYYKLSYRNQSNIGLGKRFTFQGRADLGYGEGIGDTTDLPFFKKYFAGGIRSVRGWQDNTLGPKDSTGRAFGGNLKTVFNAEFFYLPWFLDTDARTFRVSLFWDIGNVFAQASDFDTEQLRQSVGIGAEWLSPIGPLTFSFADPLNPEPGDDIQEFQFSVGTAF